MPPKPMNDESRQLKRRLALADDPDVEELIRLNCDRAEAQARKDERQRVIELVEKEVIGEDEKLTEWETYAHTHQAVTQVRNGMRRRQRELLAQLEKEEQT